MYKKLSAFSGLAAASLLAFSAAPAAAAPFTATYDFGAPGGSDIFSFDFEANQVGNLLNDISNLSNFTLGGVSIFDDQPDPFIILSDQLSVDGQQNNFFARRDDSFYGTTSRRDDRFRFSPDLAFVRNFHGFLEPQLPNLDAEFEPYRPDAWLVSPGVPVTPVPTPALLPGLLGMGFSAIRKRNLAQAEEA